MAQETFDPSAWLEHALDVIRDLVSPPTAGGGGGGGAGSKPALPGEPKDTTPSPGDGDGGGGGGGGGGGSAAPPGLDPYIQDYRLNFFATGDPPPKLLAQAKAGNWSIAYWRMQVRRSDPKYWRSAEAAKLLPGFNRVMRMLFPALSSSVRQKELMASKFYRRQAMWYLKNGVGLSTGGGAEALYGHITATARWNRANPYWRAYERNRNIGVASTANPLLYKQYLQTVKDAYGSLGMPKVPEGYLRTFFKSKYASQEGLKEFYDNLKLYAQSGSALGWWQGKGLSTGQVKTATLESGQPGVALRKRLSKAFGVRGSFLSGQQKGFGTQLSERQQLTNPLL